MTDWDQLREVGHEVSPPAFESLISTAGKRDRRARTIVLGAVALLMIGGGVGIAALNDDDSAVLQPVKDPSRTVSVTTEENPLPDGVLPLPEPDASGQTSSLDAGRYHVPLSDTLAFEIDLPQNSTAHNDGLYLDTKNGILKVEVAGDQYGVPIDPCNAQIITPVGPTVQDLVVAIRNEPIYRVGRPERVEIGGAEGTHLEVGIPAGYDALLCENNEVGMPGNPTTGNNMPPGHVGDWWILDVDGQRVVVQQLCERCDAETADRVVRTVQGITFTSAS